MKRSSARFCGCISPTVMVFMVRRKSAKQLNRENARVADLTYVKTHSGWVYVAFIIDVFSRFIVPLADFDITS
jgi:transposase InsO family protein